MQYVEMGARRSTETWAVLEVMRARLLHPTMASSLWSSNLRRASWATLCLLKALWATRHSKLNPNRRSSNCNNKSKCRTILTTVLTTERALSTPSSSPGLNPPPRSKRNPSRRCWTYRPPTWTSSRLKTMTETWALSPQPVAALNVSSAILKWRDEGKKG